MVIKGCFAKNQVSGSARKSIYILHEKHSGHLVFPFHALAETHTYNHIAYIIYTIHTYTTKKDKVPLRWRRLFKWFHLHKTFFMYAVTKTCHAENTHRIYEIWIRILIFSESKNILTIQNTKCVMHNMKFTLKEYFSSHNIICITAAHKTHEPVSVSKLSIGTHHQG